jgi:hypothetical protein
MTDEASVLCAECLRGRRISAAVFEDGQHLAGCSDSPTVMNADLHTSWVGHQKFTHLVKPQCLRVRLEGLLVVLLAFLNEAEDMPTDMGCQIEAHTLLNQLKSFLAFAHVRQN